MYILFKIILINLEWKMLAFFVEEIICNSAQNADHHVMSWLTHSSNTGGEVDCFFSPAWCGFMWGAMSLIMKHTNPHYPLSHCASTIIKPEEVTITTARRNTQGILLLLTEPIIIHIHTELSFRHANSENILDYSQRKHVSLSHSLELDSFFTDVKQKKVWRGRRKTRK